MVGQTLPWVLEDVEFDGSVLKDRAGSRSGHRGSRGEGAVPGRRRRRWRLDRKGSLALKALTTLPGLGRSELNELIEAALVYADQTESGEPSGDQLSGRAVAMMFSESSYRSRLSLEFAVYRVGADMMISESDTASTKKGESLRDTALTVAAMGADILVVRHVEAGVPDAIHDWTGVPVVNAGDGAHEHPTQALLDAVTIHRRFGSLQGLRMGIVGDIRQSRVAGSLFHAMPALGVESVLIGPASLLPEQEPDGFEMSTDLDSHLGGLDVLYVLRVQRERGTLIPDDYIERFRVDSERAAAMKPEAVVIHPGPMNREVEITGDVADGPRSLILSRVANGIPTRMAVLTALRDGIT